MKKLTMLVTLLAILLTSCSENSVEPKQDLNTRSSIKPTESLTNIIINRDTKDYPAWIDNENTMLDFAFVNDDDELDLIAWNHTTMPHKSYVYLNAGNGVVQSQGIEAHGISTPDTKKYFADVTGDGMADEIWWNYTMNAGQVLVCPAIGEGKFRSWAEKSAGSRDKNTKLYFADINGDDKADKIYWNPAYVDGGKIAIYLSNGDGSFGPQIRSTGSSMADTNFYFADVNNDNKADKIYWNTAVGNGRIRTYLSNGDGTFGSGIDSNGSTDKDYQFYFVDLNNDGRADKISYKYSYYKEYIGDKWYWKYSSASAYYANSNGSFNTSIDKDVVIDYGTTVTYPSFIKPARDWTKSFTKLNNGKVKLFTWNYAPHPGWKTMECHSKIIN